MGTSPPGRAVDEDPGDLLLQGARGPSPAPNAPIPPSPRGFFPPAPPPFSQECGVTPESENLTLSSSGAIDQSSCTGTPLSSTISSPEGAATGDPSLCNSRSSSLALPLITGRRAPRRARQQQPGPVRHVHGVLAEPALAAQHRHRLLHVRLLRGPRHGGGRGHAALTRRRHRLRWRGRGGPAAPRDGVGGDPSKPITATLWWGFLIIFFPLFFFFCSRRLWSPWI